MGETVVWSGYDFTVYGEGTSWNDVGGVYIFAGLNKMNQWVALYIGRTDSFQKRFANHERWAEAKRAGATSVHARCVSTEAERQLIEIALIKTFLPPMNEQLKKSTGLKPKQR